MTSPSILTTTTALALAVAVAATACSSSETPASSEAGDRSARAESVASNASSTPSPEPGELAIDELEKLIAADKVAVYDANGDRVRERFGKIPGAKLLSGYDWSTTELPADKAEKLVFYCSNTRCGAAPRAAEKAIVAGYSDVSVLPAGIMGWTQAGKNTETIQ